MHVGMLLFPNLTQLDLTGPYELLARAPGVTMHTIWKSTEPVRADSGLTFVPSTSVEACPPLDLLFIPGGRGQVAVMQDEGMLRFVREQGLQAKWVTAVCTGSLVLGAAGLLKGYRATSHWAYRELLPLFGAELAEGRVVVDRNRITAGGVTAGIDFGLTVLAELAELAGEEHAKRVQLYLEYDPAPPFQCGHPSRADAETVAAVTKQLEPLLQQRRAQIEALKA